MQTAEIFRMTPISVVGFAGLKLLFPIAFSTSLFVLPSSPLSCSRKYRIAPITVVCGGVFSVVTTKDCLLSWYASPTKNASFTVLFLVCTEDSPLNRNVSTGVNVIRY